MECPWPQSFQAEKPVRSSMELCAKLELSAWRAPFHQPPQTPARLAVLKQQIENKSPGFLVFVFFDLCVESCRAKGKASLDRKSTRLNSSHLGISYAVFCLK